MLDSITASLYPLSKEQNITPQILDDPPQNTTITKIKKAKDYITSCLPHAFNVTLGATSALSIFFFTHAALNHTNKALGYNPDTIQISAAIVAGTISLLINMACVNQLETAPKVIKHLLSFPKEMLKYSPYEKWGISKLEFIDNIQWEKTDLEEKLSIALLKQTCLEPFTQSLGNFYRQLYYFPKFEEPFATGVCSALSMLWIREMIKNDCDPRKMQQSLRKLKNDVSLPPTKAPDYVYFQFGEHNLDKYKRLFPECIIHSRREYPLKEDSPNWHRIFNNNKEVKSFIEDLIQASDKISPQAPQTFFYIRMFHKKPPPSHAVILSIGKKSEIEGRREHNDPLMTINFFEPNYGQFHFQTPYSKLQQNVTYFLTQYLTATNGYNTFRVLYAFIPKDNAKDLIPYNGLTLV